jgi:hypothetical protein
VTKKSGTPRSLRAGEPHDSERNESMTKTRQFQREDDADPVPTRGL